MNNERDERVESCFKFDGTLSFQYESYILI